MGIARSAAVACALLALPGAAASADPMESFYQGRTLTYIVDTAPGAAYDGYTRLIARYIGNHIPGHPSVVVQNMPGSGGRTAANWLYNIAPKDGTTLGTLSQSLAIDQLLSPEGVKFDSGQFNWIGTPVVNNNTFITWHTSGVANIEQARQKEINVGSTGGRSPNEMYPVIANAVLGTKFKIIEGYKGGGDIDLAMQRGELDGRGAESWQSLNIDHPDWLQNHLINILFQIGPRKEAGLPAVPLLTDLAGNGEQLQILQFISSAIGMGRPSTTTPGVPADRLAALRRAFDDTMKDPAFLRDAAQLNLEIDPETGAILQDLVERSINISPNLLATIKTGLSQ
jgi:tripartite-type tricarboxylate transporter receptor subunit TctC